jgi:hypothetical protein
LRPRWASGLIFAEGVGPTDLTEARGPWNVAPRENDACSFVCPECSDYVTDLPVGRAIKNGADLYSWMSAAQTAIWVKSTRHTREPMGICPGLYVAPMPARLSSAWSWPSTALGVLREGRGLLVELCQTRVKWKGLGQRQDSGPSGIRYTRIHTESCPGTFLHRSSFIPDSSKPQ